VFPSLWDMFVQPLVNNLSTAPQFSASPSPPFSTSLSFMHPPPMSPTSISRSPFSFSSSFRSFFSFLLLMRPSVPNLNVFCAYRRGSTQFTFLWRSTFGFFPSQGLPAKEFPPVGDLSSTILYNPTSFPGVGAALGGS